jgi:hypothetical protein
MSLFYLTVFTVWVYQNRDQFIVVFYTLSYV